MATTLLLCACLFVLQDDTGQIDLWKQGEADTPNLARLILSLKVHQRQEAYRYAMANIIGKQREKNKLFLLRVVRENPLIPPKNVSDNEEERHSPRRVALSILAEWHDPDLIAVFIENIDYVALDPNRSGLSKAPINEYYAAAKGLINIGKPAIEPCLKELAKNENNPQMVRSLPHTPDDYRLAEWRQENLVFVIKSILGKDETRNILQDEIHRLAKIDPNGAENLRKAADSFQLRAP